MNLRKIKETLQTYINAAASTLVGILTIAVSAILIFHSEWQLNMMQNQYIWGSCQDNIAFFQKLILQGYTSLQYVPFQDGALFRMMTGNANDIFLSLIILGWFLALVGMFLVMYGFGLAYKQKVKKARIQELLDED